MNEDMNPKEEWLKEYSKEGTKRKYSKSFDQFCEWASTSDIDLVNEYKASDPRAFGKKWGKKIVEYYNHLLEEDYKINSARAFTIAPRAFLKSQCVEVRVKRGRIAKPQIALGEHEFTLEELQRMFRIGDIQDKARLSVALSLGWGAQDFLRLKWNFIEPYLNEELEPPVAFWYQRKKTTTPIRAHLTHEALECLRSWKQVAPKSPYVFASYNGSHLSSSGLNKWLKSLVDRANIKTRGNVRFHLMRKFLFSQLSASGMNQWEAKLCVGKTVPSDILTYLKDQEAVLRNKFMNAEPRFTLTGFTNANHGKLEAVSEKIETLESIITKQELTIKEQDEKLDVLTKSLAKQQDMIAPLIKMAQIGSLQVLAEALEKGDMTIEDLKKIIGTARKAKTK